MKPFLLVCLPFLLLAFACAAPAQEKPLDYGLYPLKVGNEWKYRSGKEQVVIRVDKEVPVALVRDATAGKKENAIGFLLKIGSGPREVTEQVAILSDGIYRFSSAGKALDPPLRFYKFFDKVGTSWTVDSKTENGKPIRGTFVGGTETIRLTINGKNEELPTATVTSKDYRIDDQEVSITCWYAHKLGMVKQQIRAGKHETTLELQEVNWAWK